jgi:hypothetical protein
MAELAREHGPVPPVEAAIPPQTSNVEPGVLEARNVSAMVTIAKNDSIASVHSTSPSRVAVARYLDRIRLLS